MATGRYDRPVRGWDKLDDPSQGLPLSLRDKGHALGYGRSPRGGAKKPAMSATAPEVPDREARLKPAGRISVPALYVLLLLTHAEYNKDQWKGRL